MAAGWTAAYRLKRALRPTRRNLSPHAPRSTEAHDSTAIIPTTNARRMLESLCAGPIYASVDSGSMPQLCEFYHFFIGGGRTGAIPASYRAIAHLRGSTGRRAGAPAT